MASIAVCGAGCCAIPAIPEPGAARLDWWIAWRDVVARDAARVRSGLLAQGVPLATVADFDAAYCRWLHALLDHALFGSRDWPGVAS